jgi:nucleotide-binding universal stress UspA family protein
MEVDIMQTNIFRNIVYCTDFSEYADDAFLVAKDLAWRYGAKLYIVHVAVNYSLSPPVHETYMPIEYDPNFMEEVANAARNSIQTRYVAQLKESQHNSVHLLVGYPASEIVRFADENDADLVVMGSHGLSGIAHTLFGSTADRVVQKAHCSVLAVRPKEKK